MCDPISIGIAVGAAVGAGGAAATGGDVLQGALFGGIAGGLGGAGYGLTPGITNSVSSSLLFNTSLSAAASAGVGAGLVGGVTSTLGSVALDTLMPKTPDYSGYTPAAQQVQQFNSQQIATTGSGGRQAAASLAQAISRSKKRKLTQEDVGDLSIDTSSFASTGLQLA
tara:strand:- start:25 stop:528 length:504 start_codon:yes stop_codon:yes gene_type:complete